MTTDRDFDLITTAWLAAGPDQLPDRVVDAVAAEIHLTRQRRATRVPWRFPTMSIPARVAMAAVIGVLAVGGVFLIFGRSDQPAVGGPAPSASPPSVIVMPALTRTYQSARNGFTISYPDSWSTVPATASWVPGQGWRGRARPGHDPNVRRPPGDVIPATRSGSNAGCLVPGRMRLRCRRLGHDRDRWRQRLPGRGRRPTAVPGIVPDGVIFGAEVVSGGRGYQFGMDGHVDRAMFDAFLATFKFPVIPALERTYSSAIAGYSIDYPSAWAVTPATTPWTTGYDTMTYSDWIGTGSTTFYGTSRTVPPGCPSRTGSQTMTLTA